MITSIATQKGGTGKTTSAISISARLAQLGKTVLLIDLDPQANSTNVLYPDRKNLRKEQTIFDTIVNKKGLPITQSNVKNLDIVPSNIYLSQTDLELAGARDHREERLKKAIDPIKHLYDYIFIDCPPALNFLTLNALTASDEVILIVAPGLFELDALVQINDTIDEVKTEYNKGLKFRGILVTQFESRTQVANETLRLLNRNYSHELFNAIIPRNTAIAKATMERMDIFSFDPISAAARGYEKLVTELYNLKSPAKS